MMRILVITGLVVVSAGCQQQNTSPSIPSSSDMRPKTVVSSQPTDAPTSPQRVTALKPATSADRAEPVTTEPVTTELDTRTIQALLSDASDAQKADQNSTAIKLVKRVVLSGKATDEDLIKSAEILVRAKNIKNGVKLIETLIEKGRDETKIQLMLVSALRLQAMKYEDIRIESIKQAGQVVRELRASGALTPYGDRGIKLFLEVLASEASMCSQAGIHLDSIQALSDIADSGMPQFEQLTSSPAFDPIREMPQFLELIKKYQGSIRKRLQVGARELIDKHTPYEFDFNLRDVNGKRVTSADFPGKIMVIDFWGTWCPPCRMETPELVRLQKDYEHEVAVVGIAYEQGPPKTWKTKVKDYVAEHDVNYTTLIGDARTKKSVKGGGLSSFPTLLFVDREGKVRLQVKGYHDFARLDAVVSLLLTEP